MLDQMIHNSGLICLPPGPLRIKSFSSKSLLILTFHQKSNKECAGNWIATPFGWLVDRLFLRTIHTIPHILFIYNNYNYPSSY